MKFFPQPRLCGSSLANSLTPATMLPLTHAALATWTPLLSANMPSTPLGLRGPFP